MTNAKPNILVFAPERLEAGSEGRNRRSLNLARLLDAAGYSVTLALPNPEALGESRLRVANSESKTVASLLRRHQVVISTGHEYSARQMAREQFIQVFDVSDTPFALLAALPAPEASRLPLLLENADLLLCATPCQREFWTGAAAALGRFAATGGDTSGNLIRVVPYGHPGDKPGHSVGVVKGIFPELAASDVLLVWNAPLEPFMDPEGLVTAMRGVAQINPAVKLVFSPPTPADFQAPSLVRARALAEQENLVGTSVFFLPAPLADSERAAILAEADAVVCTGDHSPGSRLWAGGALIEAVWAGLPVVCTAGMPLAARIERDGFGFVVEPGNPVEIAESLIRLGDENARKRLASALDRVHDAFSWEKAVAPLLDYLANLPEKPARANRSDETGWGLTVRRAVEKLFD